MTRHIASAIGAAAAAVAALFLFVGPALAADPPSGAPSQDATIRALTQRLLEETDAELRWRAVAIDQAAEIQALKAKLPPPVPAVPPAPEK